MTDGEMLEYYFRQVRLGRSLTTSLRSDGVGWSWCTFDYRGMPLIEFDVMAPYETFRIAIERDAERTSGD